MMRMQLALALGAGALAAFATHAPPAPRAAASDARAPRAAAREASAAQAPRAAPAGAPAEPEARGGPFERLAAVEQLECWGCHTEISEEWARSQHAHAWIDPLYVAEVAKQRNKDGCYGCHAPVDLAGLAPNTKPALRTAEQAPLELGIRCASCHAGAQGEMLGPFELTTKAHASARDARFSEAGSQALCASCHATHVGPVIGLAKDFEASGQAERGKSCVGCHMPALERSIATDDNDEPLPPRAARSHAILGPWDARFLATAFEASAARAADRVALEFENRCGHRVPGLQGRVLRLRAELLDASGAVLAQAELALDTQHALAADARARLELPDPAQAGRRVRWVGEHQPPGGAQAVEFARGELELAAH